MSTDLSSLTEPYVHYCVQEDPLALVESIMRRHQDLAIVVIDGADVSNLKSLIAKLNAKLGLRVGYDDTNNDDLLWERLEDLVTTDIEFGKFRGCVVIISSAEHALKSSTHGLVRFGAAMHVAGEDNANPLRYLPGINPDYAPKPRSVHTIFCYKKIPRNTPNASLLWFQS